MISIHVTTRDGRLRTLNVDSGRPLMQTLKAAGIDEIAALCGGCASCGTCHVHVAEDWLKWLPAMRADEDELLGFSDWRRPNSRLACQVPVTDSLDGLTLAVAPED